MSGPKGVTRSRPTVQRSQDGSTVIRIVGAPRTPLRDSYHSFLRASWPSALVRIVGVYLGLNALFAEIYLWVGGIMNARPGSFRDAFFFSVQTMGTIGYGSMYPTTDIANVVVVAESVTGLIVTALATGLLFAKFGRTTARVVFTRHAVISPYDGVPTLMIRVGNERANQIVDAHFRINLSRTERTREGVLYYRMYDLTLLRPRISALTKSFTVMHAITPESPLYGYTPELMKAHEVELTVTVGGTDDISMQPMFVINGYVDRDIIWGARLADIISEVEDGSLLVDLSKFQETTPTEPLPDFPYPRAE